jgi:hypothetical protein
MFSILKLRMSAPWGSSYYTLCSQTYTLIVKTGFLVVNSISKSRSPSWSMCWNTYSLRALSFWTRVLRRCTMHFLANDKSFFLRITCWYLYQSILFPLPWVTALIVMVNFQVSFLPPFFHSPILFILVSSFHSAWLLTSAMHWCRLIQLQIVSFHCCLILSAMTRPLLVVWNELQNMNFSIISPSLNTTLVNCWWIVCQIWIAPQWCPRTMLVSSVQMTFFSHQVSSLDVEGKLKTGLLHCRC